MQESRRGFLKKAAVLGTVTAVSTVGAVASGSKDEYRSNGVVIGKSSKKEILYKKTLNWDAYYKASY